MLRADSFHREREVGVKHGIQYGRCASDSLTVPYV